MRADFAQAVADGLNIGRADLVERDIIIHQLLLDLSRDKFFSGNFAFKGGTCLIKCYYGYMRFSEDVDFTWKKQDAFTGQSQKAIRRVLSGVIDRVGALLEGIARRREMDFKFLKGDRRYVELGGSDRICTFKVWYESQVMKRSSFIKIQINFVESLCFGLKNGELSSLLSKGNSELRALFPEDYGEYHRAINFTIYDVREILSEKVRAILTRRGTKARDFLDIYLIYRRYGMKPQDVEHCIMNKVSYSLRMYIKYRENLVKKARLLETGEMFSWGQERSLLIGEIDERDFYSFIRGLYAFLMQVTKASGGFGPQGGSNK